MLENISVNNLKELDNVKIIDIRNPEKYNYKHILNAINIPSDQLLINPAKYITKETKYYIYCQRGIQSRKLCQLLSNAGYNVVNILGGYESWILNE